MDRQSVFDRIGLKNMNGGREKRKKPFLYGKTIQKKNNTDGKVSFERTYLITY